MSRFDELMEMTKDELQELAEKHDVAKSGNKDEIAERIVKAEGESEEAQEAQEAQEVSQPDEAEMRSTESEGLPPAYRTESEMDEEMREMRESATGPVAYEVSDAATAPSTASDTISLPNVDDEEADENGQAEGAEEDDAQAATEEDMVLVKMDRGNASYTVGAGYTFTRDHPYLPLPSSVANHLMNNVAGFRPATEQEVELYYNR